MSLALQKCPKECEGARAELNELLGWRQDADLANAAYDKPPPKKVGDYTLVEGDELAKAGLKPEDLQVPGTNFGAVVYRKGDEYTVAYRGTAGWSDVKADYEQAFDKRTGGAPNAYYTRAQEIAKKMSIKASETGSPQPRFVGHSLGGGLASAAAAATGNSATTFNAAGLHSNTVTGGMSGKEVNAIYVKGEGLTTTQQWTGLPKAYGTRSVPLDPPFHFGRDVLGRLGVVPMTIRSFLLHKMNNVTASLDRAVDAAKEKVHEKCGGC
jgi:pimeloyl-ACP methyl ester carboxylesterase